MSATQATRSAPVAGLDDGVGGSHSGEGPRAASGHAGPGARAVDWTAVMAWLRARMAAPAARWLDRMVADKTASPDELRLFLREALRPADYAEFESTLADWSARRGNVQRDDESWRKWIL